MNCQKQKVFMGHTVRSVRNFIFGSLPIFLTNREWLSTKKSGSGSGVRIGSEKKVTPDSDSRSRKIGIGSGFGSGFGSRFGSDFFKIGSGFLSLPDFWKSHSRNGSRTDSRHGSRIIGIGSEKSGVRNLEISLSRIGIEESGVTWKKPLPNPLPIPIGSQNFAHCP